MWRKNKKVWIFFSQEKVNTGGNNVEKTNILFQTYIFMNQPISGQSDTPLHKIFHKKRGSNKSTCAKKNTLFLKKYTPLQNKKFKNPFNFSLK